MKDFIDYMDHTLLAACRDTAHGNIELIEREMEIIGFDNTGLMPLAPKQYAL